MIIGVFETKIETVILLADLSGNCIPSSGGLAKFRQLRSPIISKKIGKPVKHRLAPEWHFVAFFTCENRVANDCEADFSTQGTHDLWNASHLVSVFSEDDPVFILRIRGSSKFWSMRLLQDSHFRKRTSS